MIKLRNEIINLTFNIFNVYVKTQNHVSYIVESKTQENKPSNIINLPTILNFNIQSIFSLNTNTLLNTVWSTENQTNRIISEHICWEKMQKSSLLIWSIYHHLNCNTSSPPFDNLRPQNLNGLGTHHPRYSYKKCIHVTTNFLFCRPLVGKTTVPYFKLRSFIWKVTWTGHQTIL